MTEVNEDTPATQMNTLELTAGQCTISGIIQEMKNYFGEDQEFWFRGQVQSRFGLVPGIFRQGEHFGGVSLDEAGMLREFQQRYPEKKSDHTSTEEWLSLMQHYGLPTRILDWSTNILVGIYFAVMSQQQDSVKKEEDEQNSGALYILDPRAFSSETYRFLFDEITPRTCSEYLNRMLYAMHQDIETFLRYFMRKDSRCSYHVKDEHGKPYTVNGIYNDHTSAKGFLERIRDLELSTLRSVHVNFYADTEDIQAMLVLESRLKIFNNTQNLYQLDLTSNLMHITQPSPLKMPHLNNRIRAQHGVFTYHGGKYFDGKPVLAFRTPEEIWGDKLLKLVIPAEAKAQLQKELEYAGITHDKLFPEMEHVAQAIRAKYTR